MEGRGKRAAGLAVFDLDGTIIPGQSQKRFLDFLLEAGWIGRPRYLLICGWFVLFKLGLARDVEAIQRFVFGSFAGKDVQEFDRAAHLFYEERLKGMIYPAGKELIRDHAAAGHELLLVSNSPAPVVGRVAAHLGFPRFIATKLEEKEGRFTGRIDGGNVYGDRKARRVAEYMEKRGFSMGETWAYCDHHSDLPLLLLVGNPVAANPDPKLKREAEGRGMRTLRLDGAAEGIQAGGRKREEEP